MKERFQFPFTFRPLLSFLENTGFFGDLDWKRNCLLLYRCGEYIAGLVREERIEELKSFDGLNKLASSLSKSLNGLDHDYFLKKFFNYPHINLGITGEINKQFIKRAIDFFYRQDKERKKNLSLDDILNRADLRLLDVLGWGLDALGIEGISTDCEETLATAFFLYVNSEQVFDVLDLSIHRDESFSGTILIRTIFGETDVTEAYLARGIHYLSDLSTCTWQARFPLLLSNLYDSLRFLTVLAHPVDIPEEILSFFSFMERKKPRDIYMFKERGSRPGHTGRTLQDIADELALTRERVRQVETKVEKEVSRLVEYLNDTLDILFHLLCADMKIPRCSSSEFVSEIERVFLPVCDPSWMDDLFLLLDSGLGCVLRYDYSADAVLRSTQSVDEYVDDLTQALPITLPLSYVYDKSPELVRAIKLRYRIKYGVYMRRDIHLVNLISEIIRDDFPQGYRVDQLRENDDARRLKSLLESRYGIRGAGWSPKMLTAIVVRADTTLGGKGLYISNSRALTADQELIEDVREYLVNGYPAVYYRTLFLVFESRWLQAGFTNYYSIKPIVDNNLPVGWKGKRDYVHCGDINPYSLIREICDSFGREFVLSEVSSRFPGVEDYTFLQLFNSWQIRGELMSMGRNHFLLAKDLIGWNQDVEKQLKRIIDRELSASGDGIVNSRTIFAAFIDEDGGALSDALPQIDTHFKLFSLLRCKFKDDYVFMRPNIRI